MEETNGNTSEGDASSSLDHALLESLFYNEMLMMEDPTAEPVLASPELGLLSSPAGTTASLPAPPPESLVMMPEHPPPGQPVPNMTYVNNNMNGSVQVQQAAMPVAAPPASVTQQPWPVSSGVPATSPPIAMPQQPVPPVASMPIQQQQSPAVSQVSQERAQQLVSQFATLASRLGISLPPNVLSSLTVAAAANEAAQQQSVAPLTVPSTTDPTLARPVSNDPPSVQQLETTAAAAIAAVNETRKRSLTERETTTATTTATRPLYSKRRKKPRLSDCEAKLAALKQENEMLKRHLKNVTNKAQAFDQERQEATLQMQQMLQQGASPEKLNPLLHKFSEMYSDYGRHRHDELTFHLDQLEKLVAPTTFTKMGLWTLGQNEGFYTNPKRNPIAGILRKELDITPVQGRKILEQRQQIRDVCDNLKQCLVLLGKLKGICEHKQKIFHERMSKCQEILTPIQVVKLLLWVDEHSHVLESVCPGWGSEQIAHAPAAASAKQQDSKPKAT